MDKSYLKKSERYETYLKIILSAVFILSLIVFVLGANKGLNAFTIIQNRKSHLGKLEYSFPYDGFDNGMTSTETIKDENGKNIIALKTYKNAISMEQVTVKRFPSNNLDDVIKKHYSSLKSLTEVADLKEALPECIKDLRIYSNADENTNEYLYYVALIDTDEGIYSFSGEQIDNISAEDTVNDILSSVRINKNRKEEYYSKAA